MRRPMSRAETAMCAAKEMIGHSEHPRCREGFASLAASSFRFHFATRFQDASIEIERILRPRFDLPRTARMLAPRVGIGDCMATRLTEVIRASFNLTSRLNRRAYKLPNTMSFIPAPR